MKFGNQRESRNYIDLTPLQNALRGNSMPNGIYDPSKINLTPHEYDMHMRGMSIPDIMYIRAIKAKIVPDDSGYSMVPDPTSNTPYR